jgi:hypothetical protein
MVACMLVKGRASGYGPNDRAKSANKSSGVPHRIEAASGPLLRRQRYMCGVSDAVFTAFLRASLPSSLANALAFPLSTQLELSAE